MKVENMEYKGKIELEIKDNREYIVIQIIDNGIEHDIN